ncbi:histidine kinase [Chloroflexales bacterium ZM16-3]|nr:histidine kinase [Chloroflexales bacterium ZM16-3]
MFKGLRLQMTLLYTLSALALIALVGGGGYLIVARYFQDVTDLALQHKMTHEFHILAAPIPIELLSADRDWSILRDNVDPLSRPAANQMPITRDQATRLASSYHSGGSVHDVKMITESERLTYEVKFDNGDEFYLDAYTGQLINAKVLDANLSTQLVPTPTVTDPIESFSGSAYDAELAAIFVLPLDKNGRLLFDPNPYAPPLPPEKNALVNALSSGSDLRTVTLADGSRVRMLTYRLTRSDGPAALQLGRVLTDQEHVLNELLVVLLALSGISLMILGTGSWWLAGTALIPAQQAWERQQSFVASASHELRTPLTLMRASAEVAIRSVPETSTDQRELLGDVITEADHMRRLVDDLLTLSRLDSGRLKLERSPIDLPDLLGDIQRQVSRISQERMISISLGQVVGVALADTDRLRQVLLILLDNAMRYTPDGGQITISAEERGQTVLIQVADNGSGIPPEHLPHVFERFYRADQARGTSGNAGLGLPIAKGLIEAQQGKIGITSTLGSGTTVTITLQARS